MNTQLFSASILFLLSVIFTSCDHQACKHCQGHSEDLSYYRDLDSNQDIQFVNGQGESLIFQFIERIDNFGEEQCEISGSTDSSVVTCGYLEDFVYNCDEFDIQFVERINTLIAGEGATLSNSIDGTWTSNIDIEYTKSSDSIFEIWNLHTIDSSVIHQITVTLDSLTNDNVTHYDVFGRGVSEIISKTAGNNRMNTNLFTAFYFKPRTGIIGFSTVGEELYLRE